MAQWLRDIGAGVWSEVGTLDRRQLRAISTVLTVGFAQVKGLCLLESGTDSGTDWTGTSPAEQYLRTHADTHPAIGQQSSSEDADDEESQAGEPDRQGSRSHKKHKHRVRSAGAEYQIPRNIVEAVFLT